MSSERLICALLICSGMNALSGEPAGLSSRPHTYFETAVAVLHGEPEVLEKDGRKYRVLLQDIETEEIKPKIRNCNASGFLLFHNGAKLEGIRIESAYLVNPPAGKGYSGAPIFYTTPDGGVKCAGMLNGAWSDPTGGKFSISVPARRLLDLLDK